MQCPKCDGEMETVYNEEVTINRCNNCRGLYFDQLTRDDLGYVEGQVGVDTRAVLSELAGLSEAEISALAAEGVIFCGAPGRPGME